MTADQWSINLVGFLVAAALLFLVTRLGRGWVPHAYLFSILWALNLSVAQAALSGKLRPDPETLLVLFAAWWLYLLGTLGVLTGGRRQAGNFGRIPEIRPLPAVSLVLALVALQWLSIGYEVSRRQLQSFFYGLLLPTLELRLMGVLREEDLPWFLEAWRWSYVWYIPLGLVLWRKGLVSKPFIALVFASALLSSLTKLTRTPLLHVSTTALVSWLLLWRPQPARVLLACFSLALAMWLFLVLSQTALTLSDPLARVTPAESLLSYIGASVKAYEELIRGALPREPGFYSLDALNFVLHKLSIIPSYPDIVRPAILAPIPMNTYTFLDVYTLDFGIAGALVGSFFTGALASWLHQRVRKEATLHNLVAYSYAAYAAIMAPMNNEFIRFSFIFSIGIGWTCHNLIVLRGRSPFARTKTRSCVLTSSPEGGPGQR
ncbi:MAG: O-antigen polymerase [bacterium]|nr:O-antigen polymerase [bacterium]